MKYYAITQRWLDLLEGESTGGDMEATAERLGSWYKGINPKAKPGQKGYMRKRNVPPLEDKYGEPTKYDPTKHEAPVKGKPLRYMKPQHRDYARGFIRGKILNISTRTAERDTPKGGNIQKRHNEKMALQAATLKKGRAILKKHGVPNPPQEEMMAKWIKGNNPYHPTENPEGYIRSDKK